MAALDPTKPGANDTTAAVDRWMAALDHPQKPALQALRKVLCGASKTVREGVKWNAPSFWTTEYFATTGLRTKVAPLAVIFHLGAKKKSTKVRTQIADPDGLLQWLGDDRALLGFQGLADVRKKKAAVQALVRQWLTFVT